MQNVLFYFAGPGFAVATSSFLFQSRALSSESLHEKVTQEVS
jgi:hypothetical protein